LLPLELTPRMRMFIFPPGEPEALFTLTPEVVPCRAVAASTLEEDTQTLGEVVLIGYGTQKVKDVTGSVSVVDAKTINEMIFSGLPLAIIFSWVV